MSRWLLVGALLAACAPDPAGTLQLTWRGPQSGSLRSTATAVWCVTEGRLELLAADHDTAFGLALWPRVLVRAESVKVIRRDTTDTMGLEGNRPAAALALRIPSPAVVDGWRSDSGALIIERFAEDRVTGRYRGWLRATTQGPMVMTVEGRFDAVPVHEQRVACPAPSSR